MVIVVPEGDAADVMWDAAVYDLTFEYLRDAGLAEI